MGRRVGPGPRRRLRPRVHEESDLPDDIDAFTDPAWKGKIGWAPTNASFQSFVTAFRLLEGDEAAKAWLEGIQANEPKVYEGNDAVLAAIAAGEIEVGFINHYYLMVALAEQGDAFPVRNHFLAGDDPGALVNVAGAGILDTAANPAAAQAFVDYLLTQESQEYFATETHEYPLIEGVPANPELPALDEIGLAGHRPVRPGRPRGHPPPDPGGGRPLDARPVQASADARRRLRSAAGGCRPGRSARPFRSGGRRGRSLLAGARIAGLALLPLVYLVIRALGADPASLDLVLRPRTLRSSRPRPWRWHCSSARARSRSACRSRG